MVGWYRAGEVHTLSRAGAARARGRRRLRARAAAQPAPRLHRRWRSGPTTRCCRLPRARACCARLLRDAWLAGGRRAALRRPGAVHARGDRDPAARGPTCGSRPGARDAGPDRAGRSSTCSSGAGRARLRAARHASGGHPRAALEEAFGASAREIGAAWRGHLERLATPRAGRVSRYAESHAGRCGPRRGRPRFLLPPRAWNVSPGASSRARGRRRRRGRVGSLGACAGGEPLRPRLVAPAPGAAAPAEGDRARGASGRCARRTTRTTTWSGATASTCRRAAPDVIRLQVSWRFLQPQAPRAAGVVGAARPRPRQGRAAPPRPPDRRRQPRRRARDPRPLSLISGVVEWRRHRAWWSRSPASRRRKAAARPLAGGPVGMVRLISVRPLRRAARPHIWGLEICNEPNLLCWPQPGVADAVAAMATAAARAVAGRPYPALLMLPGDLRLPGRGRGQAGRRWWRPGGRASRRRCWTACEGSTPAAPRCPPGRTTTTATRRPPTGARPRRAVIGLLAQHGWPGDRRLYLTEGGVDIDRLGPSHCPELDLPTTAGGRGRARAVPGAADPRRASPR